MAVGYVSRAGVDSQCSPHSPGQDMTVQETSSDIPTWRHARQRVMNHDACDAPKPTTLLARPHRGYDFSLSCWLVQVFITHCLTPPCALWRCCGVKGKIAMKRAMRWQLAKRRTMNHGAREAPNPVTCSLAHVTRLQMTALSRHLARASISHCLASVLLIGMVVGGLRADLR